MIRANEFWWDNITGPRRFVSRVLSVLNQNKVPLLEVPSDLPWRHTMRGEIEARFRDSVVSSQIVIDPIDAKDDIGDEDPGPFVLNRYAAFDEEIRDGFRGGKNNSIQQYIKKNNVIKNRIVWIKGLSSNSAKKWIEFCENYPIESIVEGYFVLEIQGKVNRTEMSNIQIIPYDEYVSQHDVQLFNHLYLDDKYDYSEGWKMYISALAAQLCDTDAEISKNLIDLEKFDQISPEVLIEEIASNEEYNRRGADDDSGHILSIVRKKNIKEIQNRIWRAQIQVFFPIIELERVNIIDKWFDNIQDVLKNNYIKQYDVQIYDAYDAEFGTLLYLITHRDGNGRYKLNISEKTDREKIDFFHECRNLLAHVKCCSPDQIKKIFEMVKY